MWMDRAVDWSMGFPRTILLWGEPAAMRFMPGAFGIHGDLVLTGKSVSFGQRMSAREPGNAFMLYSRGKIMAGAYWKGPIVLFLLWAVTLPVWSYPFLNIIIIKATVPSPGVICTEDNSSHCSTENICMEILFQGGFGLWR